MCIYVRVYIYIYVYVYIYIYIANGLQMSNHIPPSWLLSTWSSPCYCGGHWAPIGSKIWETCGQDKINWTYNISFGQNQGNLLQLLQLLTFSPQKKSQPKELEKFTNKMRDLDALSLSQQPITTLYDILMPPQRSAQLSYPTRTYLCAEMWLLAPPRGLCRAGDRVEVLPPKLRRFGFGNLFFFNGNQHESTV